MDFKEQLKPIQVDWKEQIMALPIAVDPEGRPMFYGLEACKKDNVVIIYDAEGKGWCRGLGKKRYRVMLTGTDHLGPFPGFKSGRNER